MGRFYYLSAPQVAKLIFSPKSIKYAREHLKDLYQREYLERLYLPRTEPEGSSLAIYCLDKNGIKYLRKAQLAPEGRFHRQEEAEREDLFLKHTLSANDLVIHGYLLGKTDPCVRPVRFVSERELKRQPGLVRLSGRTVKVIPDGWVHLEKSWPGRAKPSHYYIAWELDRATVHRPETFRRKIRALTTWMEHGYIEQFGAEGLTVAFVTTGSHRRLEQMVAWTQEELRRLDRQEYAELFLFSSFDPGQVTPEFVFNQAHWRQPFEDKPTRLLVEPC